MGMTPQEAAELRRLAAFGEVIPLFSTEQSAFQGASMDKLDEWIKDMSESQAQELDQQVHDRLKKRLELLKGVEKHVGSLIQILQTNGVQVGETSTSREKHAD
jgi:hypothetical protein